MDNILKNLSAGLLKTATEMSNGIYAEDSSRYVVEDWSEYDVLEEGTGALKDMPDHIKKVVTHYSNRGGENSESTTHGVVKSYSSLRRNIADAMKTGHPVTIHHNNKVIGSVHVSDDYGRKKFGLNDSKGTILANRSEKAHGTGKYDKYSGRYIPARERNYTTVHHSKDEAINKVVHNIVHNHIGSVDLDDKNTYKEHHIEIKSHAPDKNRAELRAKRESDRKTTERGNLDHITDTAALKVAKNHLGDQKSPKAVALGLHAKLGDLISKGANSRDIHSHISTLQQHIRDHGTDEDSYKHTSYSRDLKDLKQAYHPHNYYRNKDNIRASLRRESVEESLDEGTWAFDHDKIKKIMKKPIMAAKAQDKLYHIFGDDELHDNLHDDLKQLGKKYDVRPTVARHLKRFVESHNIDEARRGRPPKDEAKRAAFNAQETNEPKNHIMTQLAKAKVSTIPHKVLFKDGSSHYVLGHHAEKILDKYASMKPDEKAEFQKKVSVSHAALKAEL